MKRILVREKKSTRIKSLKRGLREENRSIIDLKALREVQSQFDCLMEQMMSAKLMLAGLAIGADDVSTNSSVDTTGQQYVDE